jgi:predicted transcriptional regulator
MKDNESNVLLIDRRGTIRYASYGRITDRQFAEIEELLDNLVNLEN